MEKNTFKENYLFLAIPALRMNKVDGAIHMQYQLYIFGIIVTTLNMCEI